MLQKLLFPFALLYQLLTAIRNSCYDWQIFKTTPSPVLSINIGNLGVGGTGKTPHLAYLVNLLAKKYQITTLSRGYGRKTKGFLLANSQSNASTLGDEPMLFYSRFSPSIAVTVGENRVQAVETIQKKLPNTELILLDDALQHRAIQAQLNLVLTIYEKPFYKDFLLPMGRLRESRKGMKRANAVIVSKCPKDLSLAEQQRIIQNIKKYLPDNQTPIFFSYTVYQDFLPVYAQTQASKVLVLPNTAPIILLTGIANAEIMYAALQTQYELLVHIALPDHHHYTQKSVEKILKTYKVFDY
jgi:tetraacyldisaccharide 4'-kinase